MLPPLDAASLERIAIRYVEKYATTRAKLRDYLRRKLRERGWTGEGEPGVEGLVQRIAELGYVDDAAYAEARGAALVRRGYGPRRVSLSLKVAGVSEHDGAAAEEQAREGAWQAAIAFARRKRIGPFASVYPERPMREKAFAALVRAGHDLRMARRITEARPDIIPDEEID